MTASNDMETSDQWRGRLSPSDVHNVLFTRAGLGRRGYDEVEVDVFLERVQQELTRLIAEKADLRDEVARLKSQVGHAGAAPAADGALSTEEANLQAVRLLAAAQQTADVYVADAEKYSQRLTVDAREHSEQLVEDARRTAQRLVAEAEQTARAAAGRSLDQSVDPAAGGPAGPTQQELDDQVAYLRTFGQVVRVQLKAYLEALLRDVEEEWGRADPAVLSAAPPAPRVVPPAPAPPDESAGGRETPPSDLPGSDGDVGETDRGEDVVDLDDDSAAPHPAHSNGSGPARTRKRTTVNLHSR